MTKSVEKPAAAATPQVPVMGVKRDISAASRVIEKWIDRKVPGMAGVEVREASAPTGTGVANETILINAVLPGGRTAGFVVRVDADDQLFLDVDPLVHYQMYQALADAPGVPVPAMLGFENDRSLLGERFYVMERLDGRAAPDNPHFTTGGWVCELGDVERGTMWREMVEVLARLHALDRARFPFLEKPELGASGLEQTLNFWLRYAKWSGADSVPAVAQAAAWLVANRPEDCTSCATWGGGGPQNFLFDAKGHVVSILDWDMASLAGAENDLAIWFVMDAHRILPGFGRPRQTIELWESLSGRQVRHMDWHLVFASFMLDLIVIRLPKLLRAKGQIDDAGLATFMARAGCRSAAQLGLAWGGPELAPPIRYDD